MTSIKEIKSLQKLLKYLLSNWLKRKENWDNNHLMLNKHDLSKTKN